MDKAPHAGRGKLWTMKNDEGFIAFSIELRVNATSMMASAHTPEYGLVANIIYICINCVGE